MWRCLTSQRGIETAHPSPIVVRQALTSLDGIAAVLRSQPERSTMGIPNSTKLLVTNALADEFDWVSVHTGAGGGTNGANEATGGGYARQQTTFTPGTTNNVGAEVNVPVAAGTYTEGGLWSASSGGTFGGSAAFAGGSVIVSGSGASIDISPTWSA